MTEKRIEVAVNRIDGVFPVTAISPSVLCVGALVTGEQAAQIVDALIEAYGESILPTVGPPEQLREPEKTIASDNDEVVISADSYHISSLCLSAGVKFR